MVGVEGRVELSSPNTAGRPGGHSAGGDASFTPGGSTRTWIRAAAASLLQNLAADYSPTTARVCLQLRGKHSTLGVELLSRVCIQQAALHGAVYGHA